MMEREKGFRYLDLKLSKDRTFIMLRGLILKMAFEKQSPCLSGKESCQTRVD